MMKVDERSSTLLQNAWRATPAATGARWSKGLWWRTRHLDYLSTRLAQIASGKALRLFVSMPPRHGKSETISHWFPTWFLANWPNKHVILASYEATFAASWGKKVRDSISENSQAMGVGVKGDTSAVSAWQTTAGGGMVTAGVGGPITGRGADVLLVDDPIKNMEEAQSPVMRDNIWQWWQTTARTRLEPGASAVVVMTRWDADDLVGRLQTDPSDAWEGIVLPAVAERNDLLGREVGEPLWPERYSLPALDAIRRDVGEDAWASLYQQRPNPRGRGYYFDLEAAQALRQMCQVPISTTEGGAVMVWQQPVKGARYVAGGDCAWGEKGAYSVLWIEDYQTGQQVAEVYGRLAYDELADLNVRTCRLYNNAYTGIERNGEGRKVAEKMVELGYGDRMYWHDQKRNMPGWLTDAQSRPSLLLDYAEAVKNLSVRPMCKDGAGELLSFVRDEKGHPGPRPGAYADHVFAGAIARRMRKEAHFNVAGGKPVFINRGW